MTIFWQILIEEVTDGDALLSLIPIKKKKKLVRNAKAVSSKQMMVELEHRILRRGNRTSLNK